MAGLRNKKQKDPVLRAEAEIAEISHGCLLSLMSPIKRGRMGHIFDISDKEGWDGVTYYSV
jgi:hypothetical protein